MSRFTGVLGLALILAGAYLFSTNRRAIRPKVVLWGLALQIALALLVLRTGFSRVFEVIGAGVTRLRDFAQTGSNFGLRSAGQPERAGWARIRLQCTDHHHLT